MWTMTQATKTNRVSRETQAIPALQDRGVQMLVVTLLNQQRELTLHKTEQLNDHIVME